MTPRKPCTSIDESLATELKEQVKRRSKSRSPQQSPSAMNTSRTVITEKVAPQKAIEEIDFSEVNAYVSQKNHGVIPMDPLSLEK